MKKIGMILAAGVLASVATPALAQNNGGTRAEVVERNARGQATKVRVEGRVYNVCTADSSDGCINPREAGLNFGNVPLNRWPGQPASQGRRR